MGKRIAVLLASIALLLGVAACSGGEKGNDQGKAAGTNQPGSANGDKSNTTAGSKDKKYTVTAMDFLFSGIPPKDGRGVKMINEKFNVDFQKDTTVYSEYEQKQATVISSGNIPDIIGFISLDANFYKWAEQGAFLPLDDFIKDYPTLKVVPDDVWAPAKLNGKIYAIPKYFPATYLNTIIIRQDWLDNLGLKVPTSYEELKQVALAFTNNDPDKNGKKDTYGMVMGQQINPNYAMGPYWETGAWYHKDKNGNYIPGFISDARKELTSWLHDLYQAGAITHDFALMNPTQYNQEFYSGKGGIYLGSPRGMNENYMKSLMELQPGAKFTALPPFKAPDGSQGFTAGSGYYNAIALSAKLKDQPDKVRRILEMIDAGRKFIPLAERNGKNPDFDWVNGNEGTGYKIENGVTVLESTEKGLSPFDYLPDNKMWAPKDEMNEYSKTYGVPQLRSLVADLEKVHSNSKHYINPIYQVNSPTYFQKADDLYKKLTDVQTKMITGATPISDWDKMVEDFMKNGGEQIIKEVNDGIKKIGYQPSWK
jgi:putative aldouronate transport system substrate-binding protein